jgi:hypothetical protein
MGGFRCFSGLTGITDWSRGCIGLGLGLYLKKLQIILKEGGFKGALKEHPLLHIPEE